LANKKGITLTAIIIAAITAASFFVWIIPQNLEQSFVISDFESNLDEAKEIHQSIMAGIDEKFQDVLDGKITPEEYIEIAEVSSSQINSQIIKIIKSQATEEWYESYLNYANSLKEYNSYITETIVIAKMIENNANSDDMNQELQKIDGIKNTVKSLIDASNETRP